MSWVAIDDVLGAVHHALMTDGPGGPVNVTAPDPVTDRDVRRDAGPGARPARRCCRSPRRRSGCAFGEMADAALLAQSRVAAGAAAGFGLPLPLPRARRRASAFCSAGPDRAEMTAFHAARVPYADDASQGRRAAERRHGLDHRRRRSRGARASTCTPSASATASATPSSSRPRAGSPQRSGVRRARRRRHRPARLRRLGAHRRHAVPKDTPLGARSARGIPVTYVPGPEHHLPLPRAGLGRGAGRPRHLHRRQRARLQRLPRLPARVHRGLRADGEPGHPGRRRGGARLTIHTPLIALTKARDHRSGAWRSGVDYGITMQLLRPGARRRGLRPLRRLPAPAQGVRGGRVRRTRRGTRPGRLTHDLRGQGDLLHPAGRGRQHRPAGGVLPLRRLQPVDGPRGRTGPSAICQFCDTDFVGTDGPGGGRFASPDALARRGGRRRGRADEPRRAASWSAPAASRCCSSTRRCRRAARARLRGRGRDQRHARRRRPASTGSA